MPRNQSGNGENFSTTEFDRSSDNQIFERLKELSRNPTVRYVAAGLAVAAANRIINKLAPRYPEIAGFLRENMDLVEGKVNDYKGEALGSSDSSSLT
jgi:alpha-amylase/alpha-mannosidase (GH57 family)